jgi:hypothetical protein
LSKALLVANRPKDQLVVTKLDRLGRSLEHLIELSKTLHDRGVDLVVLDQGIDTSTAVGRMFFQILGAIAEFEHALMSERTRDGLAAARARAELVTLIVGVVAAVTTLIVGTLAYFKDRRDTRTQLLRDVELVERFTDGTVWHDGLGIHAQSILKIYVYERVHALAQREELGKRAARSLFVLVAAGIGLMAT